ncbi:alpha/beta fold hydrolase [Macrococcus lamae]|uniref:Alpha/beta hydrolase n=1 Tax=Macrococcus lamae TaxID=198484 RepID=A0A4R6BTJ4_9STAP|nr:alpha/beta fold hydrolase [Macrococcus lamae]TDM07503.1 hypothetical protein ERX29_08695 [Macrococcus lamae]
MMSFKNKYQFFYADHINKNKPIHLLISQDGQFALEENEKTNGYALELNKLIIEEKLPFVLLTIDNVENERANQYCPYQSGNFSFKTLGYNRILNPVGKEYSTWLIEFLLPNVIEEYNIEIESITLLGISMGALISLYTLLEYPNEINNLISISGAYYINQESIEQKIIETSFYDSHKIYLDYGTEEVESDNFISTCFIESNERIINSLREQPIELVPKKFEGHHHDYLFFKERVKKAIKEII